MTLYCVLQHCIAAVQAADSASYAAAIVWKVMGVCMLMCLQSLEQFWLAKSPFLAGNEISIADLLHCCELDQLCLLDGADQVRSAHTISSTMLVVFKSISRLPACNMLMCQRVNVCLRSVCSVELKAVGTLVLIRQSLA